MTNEENEANVESDKSAASASLSASSRMHIIVASRGLLDPPVLASATIAAVITQCLESIESLLVKCIRHDCANITSLRGEEGRGETRERGEEEKEERRRERRGEREEKRKRKRGKIREREKIRKEEKRKNAFIISSPITIIHHRPPSVAAVQAPPMAAQYCCGCCRMWPTCGLPTNSSVATV